MQIILDSSVRDNKAMQPFESESLLIGGEHSQKVKAPPIKSDYGSKDCVDLSSPTAESRIILGSQSPRRKEILGYFNLPFQTAVSGFDEESVPFKGDPVSYAKAISVGKCEALSHQYPDAIVITADTVVYGNGKTYGKPETEQEGFSFLKELAGQWHSVFTAVTLAFKGQQRHHVEETKVLFNPLTDNQIKAYQRAVHWPDKAAGYMIQGEGSLIVRRIEGCYYNVMGLPVNALADLLKTAGIDLWEYLRVL